jgi:hypothetical protein
VRYIIQDISIWFEKIFRWLILIFSQVLFGVLAGSSKHVYNYQWQFYQTWNLRGWINSLWGEERKRLEATKVLKFVAKINVSVQFLGQSGN